MSLITKAIPKIIGGFAGAALLYDTWSDGTRRGIARAKTSLAQMNVDSFVGNMSGSGSTLENGLQKWHQRHVMDSKLLSGFVKVKEGAFALGKELINNAIPIGLAAGAIIGAPIVAIPCAGLLLALGIKTMLFDVMGFGKKATG